MPRRNTLFQALEEAKQKMGQASLYVIIFTVLYYYLYGMGMCSCLGPYSKEKYPYVFIPYGFLFIGILKTFENNLDYIQREG